MQARQRAALPGVQYVDLTFGGREGCPFIFLLSTIFITHKLSYEDCQQLLQVLFTSAEAGWIPNEACKHVLGQDGLTNVNVTEVDKIFPLTSPAWDPNTNFSNDLLVPTVHSRHLCCCVLANKFI